jgi:hypothetical protein
LVMLQVFCKINRLKSSKTEKGHDVPVRPKKLPGRGAEERHDPKEG